MAYQARKHKRFREDFELLNEDGEVAHTLHVDLDADDVAVRISRKYTELARAYADVSGINTKVSSTEEAGQCFDKLGRAVTDLFEAVFGKEDTAIILDFYENRYVEMTKEVVPFITQTVVPRCIEIRNENKKGIMKGYNRKQRRALFKIKG